MSELAIIGAFGFGIIIGILLMGGTYILCLIEENKSRYGVIRIPDNIKEKAREFIKNELKNLQVSYKCPACGKDTMYQRDNFAFYV